MSDMQTLSGLAAHNAVAGLVQLYAGIMADHQRELTMVRAQFEAAKQQAERAASEIKGLQEIIERGQAHNTKLIDQLRETQRQLDVYAARERAQRDAVLP